MKKIPLTQGLFALLDDEDFEIVSRLKWYAAKKKSGTVYAQREQNKTCLKMHRYILGITDSKTYVDHINGNGLDNRRKNLRICSPAENCRNRLGTPNSTSKYKGVSWSKNTGKWKAQIRVNGILHYLGIYESEKDAAKIYNDAALVYFTDFAKLNDFD